MNNEENVGMDSKCAPMNAQTPNSIKVYLAAKAALDTSLVPPGDDPELGCAITVNKIFERALGSQIGGDTSTNLLYQALVHNSGSLKFLEVSSPLAGDVIISPTGYGTNPAMSHGHVGIVALYGILSNHSADGFLEERYQLSDWYERYQKEGGYPVKFFRVQ